MTIPEILLTIAGSLELSIVVKASLLLVVGLIAARLATTAKASVRHLALATTFAALLALPLITVTVPQIGIDVPVKSAQTNSTLTLVSEPAGTTLPTVSPLNSRPWRMPSWAGIARVVWISVTSLQLILLSLHLLRLRRVRRGGIPWLDQRQLIQSLATECGVRTVPDLLLHESIAGPITCGVRQAAILLPIAAHSWSDADLRRALIHELEHVRRRDWATQLAARVAIVCYWFQPLAWIAWRQMCLEAERASDDAVLRNAESTEYAEQLVGLARQMSNPQAQLALGMANRSDLSARVCALLDDNQQRGRAGWFTTAGAIAVAGLVLVAIAPITAVAQSSGGQNAAERSRRVTPLDRALYEAAEAGDLQQIDALLNAGANTNAVIPGDGSPLIGAARKGQLAAVIRLLDRGADPNMPVSRDGNPLIMAAAHGHADVVSLLLDRGARIEEVVPSDENALIQASGKGHLEVVKLLVARRANVNARLWVEESGTVRGIVGGVIGGVPGGVGAGVAGGVGAGVPGGVVGGVPGVIQRAQSPGEWRSPLSMARQGRHQAVIDFLVASGARE